MALSTQNHNRTLSGSVGAGMKSLFGAGERRFYTLVHKVSSRYHKAGEAQQIIVDEIEMGRDAKCQVRFDESFSTVSRRHAAIVRDGNNWKLVQLSQTNPTFLNGQPVNKEWYLQNGDEIQLSQNGPKLGFVIPEGKMGAMQSIAITTRLNLFRQQALRPYKRALWGVVCVLLICCGLGIYKGCSREKGIDEIMQAQDILKDVYYLYTEKVVLELPRGEEEVLTNMRGYAYGWSGTGFLLNDGRFVTARHCVEGWLYNANSYLYGLDPITNATVLASSHGGCQIKSYLRAVSSKSGTSFRFCSTDFKIDHSRDYREPVGMDDEGFPLYLDVPFDYLPDARDAMYATDWAYTIMTNGCKGTLEADALLSKSLHPMQKLYACGFPKGLGVDAEGLELEPIISEMSVSREGLAPNGYIMHSRGIDHGNSGGPVFALRNGKLVVVGIVSQGTESEEHNLATPICYIY